MKPTALLVNTSRGAVVNEKALTTALEQKWITGACLDVLERFPPPSDSRLLELENLTLTPHMAGSTTEARVRVVTQAADNIVQVLNGRLPPSEFIINKELDVRSS
jgi:phosphoglycerate dehydrogenase-like enzyme